MRMPDLILHNLQQRDVIHIFCVTDPDLFPIKTVWSMLRSKFGQ